MEFTDSAPAQEIVPQLAPLAGMLVWQILLLMLAGLFLLYRMVRGMQLGGARQFVSLLALAMGAAIGWSIGPALVPALRGPLGLPDFAVYAFSSALVCIVVIALVEVMGAIFCAKTEEQTKPGVRRFYALSGLFLGLVNGLITLFIAVLGIKLLGTLANAQLYTQLNQLNKTLAEAPPVSGSVADGGELDGLSGPVTVTKEAGNPVAVFLARLKNSMELGPGKQLTDRVDPLPPEIYRLVQKAVKVLSDADSMQLFLQHPDISRVTQHEVIAQLAQDPEVQRQAQARDLPALMRNPKLVTAANDPEVQKDFSTVNFEAALDYALTAHKDTLQDSINSGEISIGEAK